MDDQLLCDNCDVAIENESDMLDYEDMSVCEYCFDELRRLDERAYQELTNDYE
jgi:hypothetical protein